MCAPPVNEPAALPNRSSHEPRSTSPSLQADCGGNRPPTVDLKDSRERAIIGLRRNMLIPGYIIAGKLGVRGVNSIAGLVHLSRNSELVRVHGYLGVAAAGVPEADLEQVILVS